MENGKQETQLTTVDLGLNKLGEKLYKLLCDTEHERGPEAPLRDVVSLDDGSDLFIEVDEGWTGGISFELFTVPQGGTREDKKQKISWQNTGLVTKPNNTLYVEYDTESGVLYQRLSEGPIDDAHLAIAVTLMDQYFAALQRRTDEKEAQRFADKTTRFANQFGQLAIKERELHFEHERLKEDPEFAAILAALNGASDEELEAMLTKDDYQAKGTYRLQQQIIAIRAMITEKAQENSGN